MSGLKVMTIGLIAVLCILFIYVAEDIPIFGDPEAASIKYVELFAIKADPEEELLDRQIIPPTLLGALVERGLPIPCRMAKIPNVPSQWDAFVPKEELYYPKEEKYYFIRREGSDLRVYRYAFVVRWIEKGLRETAVPNMVTYGLADYRGYDTLGETTVIFTAGVSVILLLRRRSRL